MKNSNFNYKFTQLLHSSLEFEFVPKSTHMKVIRVFAIIHEIYNFFSIDMRKKG